MSVSRQANILNQQRIDVPHLRALESSICADFDVLAGRITAGKSPLVVKGLKLISTGVVAASALKLEVADALVIHYLASESGSIFAIPTDRSAELLSNTNARLVGSFAPGATNYVGLDFTRVVDDTTADLTMFLDATKESEMSKTVPLARTIDYRIVISTRDFAAMPGVCPVAKVVTSSTNDIVSIEDARNLLGRLGSGGTIPNRQASFTWPESRKEYTSGDVFAGGDKTISSLKSWMDAAMTRIWEIGGGEYWYSATADRNVREVHTGAAFVSNGEFYEWSGTHAHWKGIRLVFDNSTGWFNAVADQTGNSVGLTDLADGDCIYVDIDRTQNRSGGSALVAQKAPLITLGAGTPPGSRVVLAWRFGTALYTRDQSFAVGSSFKLATTAASGTVKVTANDADPIVPLFHPGTELAVVAGLSRLTASASGSIFVAGDLQIGMGVGEGDHNVQLYTDGAQYQTRVVGAGTWTAQAKAALEVDNQALPVDGKNRIVNLKGNPTTGGSSRIAAFFESDGAMGHASVTQTPKTPAPSGTDPARVKVFFRPNRWWRADVRVTTFSEGLPAYTTAGAGVGKTLTAAGFGALTVDTVLLSTNDRVLFMLLSLSNSDYGIYKLTQQGTGGQPWILTRAIDADGVDEFVEGMATRVTAGSWAGTCFMAGTLGPYTIDTTPVAFQMIPNIQTKDQECRMWADGSVTVIAESVATFTPTIPAAP